jgi:hypothetical protein
MMRQMCAQTLMSVQAILAYMQLIVQSLRPINQSQQIDIFARVRQDGKVKDAILTSTNARRVLAYTAHATTLAVRHK